MPAPTTSLLSSGKRSRFSGSLHGSPPSLPSTAVIKRRHDPNWPTPNFVNLKEAKLPIRVSCASPPVERWSLYQLPKTTTQPSNQLLHTTNQLLNQLLQTTIQPTNQLLHTTNQLPNQVLRTTTQLPNMYQLPSCHPHLGKCWPFFKTVESTSFIFTFLSLVKVFPGGG